MKQQIEAKMMVGKYLRSFTEDGKTVEVYELEKDLVTVWFNRDLIGYIKITKSNNYNADSLYSHTKKLHKHIHNAVEFLVKEII